MFVFLLEVINFTRRHDVEIWRTPGGKHMKSEHVARGHQGVPRSNYKLSGGFLDILHGSTRTSMEGENCGK